mmetsp:Transcript_8108/g.32766  ORF Transcript_8108/g.32766 Transcript_8108/m.32766 type:complete len:646 (-) Transcript_8108:2155-4092(-)
MMYPPPSDYRNIHSFPTSDSRHPGGSEERPQVHPPVRGPSQRLLHLVRRGVERGARPGRRLDPRPRGVAILGRHPGQRASVVEQPPEVHQLRVQRSLRGGLLHDALALGIRRQRPGLGCGVGAHAKRHVARLRRRQLVVAAQRRGVVRVDGVAHREANLIGERVSSERRRRDARRAIRQLTTRVCVCVGVLLAAGGRGRSSIRLGRGREGRVGRHRSREDGVDAGEFKLATRGSKNQRLAPLEPLLVVEGGGRGEQVVVVLVSAVRGDHLVVKLGRVEAEAVGDVRGVGALDGLAQARHHGVNLLREVVVEVQLEAAVLGGDLVGVVGAVGESLAAGALVHGAAAGDLLGGGVRLEGDDVRDGFALVDALSLPRGSQPQRHLHVRLVGGVRVILRPLRELLGDDELVHRHRAVHQVLPALAKRLVDSLDDVLGGVSGENLLQREVTLLLRQGGPIAADNVETLLLNHRGVAAVGELLDHEGGVLLLLEEQHGLVKAVHLNLQNLEALVGQLLELLRHVHNLRDVRRLGVDHDRVGVAIDDVPAQVTLREVHGGLKDLAPLQGDQLRQGLGVEPRRGETEAAVHGVCGELERHLANVELLGPRRVALRLDHVLHLAPAVHQLLDHLRQHNLGRVGIRGKRRRRGRG